MRDNPKLPVKIVNDYGIVAQSRNLRGVLDYARKFPVELATYWINPDGVNVATFHFWDGSICRTDYASLDVFRWFLKGRRSWGKPTEYVVGPVITFDYRGI